MQLWRLALVAAIINPAGSLEVEGWDLVRSISWEHRLSSRAESKHLGCAASKLGAVSANPPKPVGSVRVQPSRESKHLT